MFCSAWIDKTLSYCFSEWVLFPDHQEIMRNVIYSLSGMHVNLCAMVKLTNMDRARAIGFLEAGWVQTDVAIHFGVSRLTISRLQARLRATGDVADRPRSGRPRVTTRRQDRYIEVQATRSRFVSAHQIQLNIQAAAGPGNQRISTQTIRNRLHRAGLRARPTRTATPPHWCTQGCTSSMGQRSSSLDTSPMETCPLHRRIEIRSS